MKIVPIMLLSSVSVFACNSNDHNVKATGQRKRETYTSFKLIQTSAAQFDPYTEMTIRGGRFQIVVSDNDTTFMSTRDSVFKTPEGFHVGTHFSQLPKNVRDQIFKEQGFSYWTSLQSGWRLGFCEGVSCTDHTPMTLLRLISFLKENKKVFPEGYY